MTEGLMLLREIFSHIFRCKLLCDELIKLHLNILKKLMIALTHKINSVLFRLYIYKFYKLYEILIILYFSKNI